MNVDVGMDFVLVLCWKTKRVERTGCAPNILLNLVSFS